MPRMTRDLTGQRFGKLTVQRFAGYQWNAGQKQQTAAWLCRCDCGTEKTIWALQLNAGKTKSCGCLRGQGNQSRAQIIEAWLAQSRPHTYSRHSLNATVKRIEAMEAKRGVRYDGYGADFIPESEWPREPALPCCDRPCCAEVDSGIESALHDDDRERRDRMDRNNA